MSELKTCGTCGTPLTAGDRTIGRCGECGGSLPAEPWQSAAKAPTTLLLRCEVADAATVEEARLQLDAFRESVVPSLNYGITLSDATLEPPWWVVTLRLEGDDEDGLYVVQKPDEHQAVKAAEQLLLEDDGFAELEDVCEACGEDPCIESCGACDYPKRPTIYVNHVVRCDTKPEHVRATP